MCTKMKGYENVDVFENEEWDLILNKILEHYKDGKFKLDPEKSSQGDAHRSKKSGAKQILLNSLNVSNGKDIIKVAFNLLLDFCKQQNEPWYVEKLEEYRNLNKKLIKKNQQLQREKDNRDACLQSNVTLEFDKWKKNYVCEREDVNKLNDEIQNLQIQRSDKDDMIQELKHEVKGIRENCNKQLSQNAFEMAELELANQDKPNIKKLKDEIKQLKSSSCDGDKEKKYKKIILELKNRIVELEVDAM